MSALPLTLTEFYPRCLREHNRPATFQHPWFSLLDDFRLYADLWRSREKF